MSTVVDLTGRRFGRWIVESLCEDSGKVKHWHCVCDCGNRRRVFGGDLKRGGSLSCGCLMREKNAQARLTHGMSFHPAHRSWVHARSRCENVGGDSYADYGGRGIRICSRWDTFEAFWEDMGPTWSPGLSLDRIDVNGDYEPDNCRWATPKVQSNNRRDTHFVKTPKGTMPLAEAARTFGLSQGALKARIRYGWPEADLFRPVIQRRPRRKSR